MTSKSQLDAVNEAADVIGKAIAAYYGGRIPNVYAVLGALSTIAVDIIARCPSEDQPNLLEAWDETPAYVRAQVTGKQH